ncbi:hypothetical protein MHPYR_10317 [uncultured Mycobacterium sp.]|uniref:Uncharacterized protein n=1 Tax=uncultured Mycobacterium sp. TaxID=171292 RepID=A0A1Y5NWP6_9MYCO|nr:hypothetical protein MHPYR_10317 [uncultured Mycobacterium sp.]
MELRAMIALNFRSQFHFNEFSS